MKSLLTLLAILFAVNFSYAQTNTFPSSGDVGIGTTSPSTTLDVNGATTTTPTIINRNTSYNSTNATGTVALGLYFANHGAAKIEASKYTTNITDMNFYGEYGFNTPSLIMTLHPNGTTGGNVGIGTTAPNGRLNIFDPTAGNSLLVLSRATNSAVKALDVTLDASDNTVFTTANSDLNFKTNFNGGSTLSTMYLNYQGNVGIGTTSPTAKLDIESSTNSSWASQIINNGTTNAHGLYVNIGSGSTGIPFRVDVNGSDMFQVSNNGNVTIGTTDAQGYKLAVNGSMIATSIKVKPYANWPDYVFKPQYNLPSLDEVKTYIDQNHHLPEVPSAFTVEKDGQDLGEMNKVLLKKVEELTLYLIEKDKEVKEIKDQKELQQKQLNTLQSQVEQLLKHK